MKKQEKIKYFIIISTCLLFSFTSVFAEEGNKAPNMPSDLPSSITPEKIRAYMSKPKEENYIILNFDNADLRDVINTVSSITNENFILSPGVNARITIHSAKKIPVSEVLSVFESVLDVNGMSLVKSGEFYKVVTGASAKQKRIEVRKGNEIKYVQDVDRPVTQIIPVKYVPVAEVSTVLTPMLSQFGSIIPNPRNNLLIVNDLSSNIIRLLKVLKEIDVDAFKNTRMSIFKPKYSDVLSLTNELTEVLNALNLTREGIALVPIERINSLIIFSGSPTLLLAVEGWIKKLDEEVISGQNIFVYPVQNVKAENIADILRTLYEAASELKPKATQKTHPVTKKGAPRRQITRTTRQQQSTDISRVEIITFKQTNSLVVLAPPGVYREMVETIKKLDVYPREVLIEAVIAKVDISSSDEFGIRWSVLHNIKAGGDDFKGLVQGSITDSLPLVPSGNELSLVSGPTGGFSYLFLRPDKLSALIYALASKSKVKILQSPRLLVKDQEEASIEVGSDIPIASSTTTTTTTDTLTQNIEYRTVGIKLKIKPTISEEKTVVLDIEQEVSDVIAEGRTVGGLTYPEFTTTKTKTSIIVPDKQGIIIGGIMEETMGKSYEGIPLLSSLPILGPIFRYTKDRIEKTELIIIITPYVITNKAEGEKLTTEFMEKLTEIKDFLGERQNEVSRAIPEKNNSTPVQ